MEFTGFCYSNSRVSPFYLRNFFFFGGGEMGGGKWEVGSNRKQYFKGTGLVLRANDCCQNVSGVL